jgi:hypothetical protein
VSVRYLLFFLSETPASFRSIPWANVCDAAWRRSSIGNCSICSINAAKLGLRRCARPDARASARVRGRQRVLRTARFPLLCQPRPRAADGVACVQRGHPSSLGLSRQPGGSDGPRALQDPDLPDLVAKLLPSCVNITTARCKEMQQVNGKQVMVQDAKPISGTRSVAPLSSLPMAMWSRTST